MHSTIRHKTTASQAPVTGLDPSSQQNAGIHVETIRDTATLSRIETEWRKLCERAPGHGFFQTFSWIWPWWKYLGEPSGYELRIVTVRMDGRLVLIWPLVVRRQGLWRVGVWLGSGTGQYGDLVIEEGAEQNNWCEAAWYAIKTDCGIDILHLERIREDAVVRHFLTGKKGKLKETATSPYIPVEKYQDWDAFHTQLKRSFRRNLRSAHRRLRVQGKLQHRFIDDPLEIEQIVTKSIRLKLSWLMKRNTYGRLLERPEAENWLVNTTIAAQEEGTLKLAVLSLDDTVIATQIGFLHHQHYYSYFGSFDIGYSSFKPGKVETENALQWAFENGVETFDLMPPADEYKLDWSQHKANIATFVSYPSNWGRLGKFWYSSGLRDKAVRIYWRFPRKFRRLIVRLLAI